MLPPKLTELIRLSAWGKWEGGEGLTLAVRLVMLGLVDHRHHHVRLMEVVKRNHTKQLTNLLKVRTILFILYFDVLSSSETD